MGRFGVEASRSAAGFTLLEIVVAMTITAIAFTGIFGVYKSTLDTAAAVETLGSLDHAGRTALSVISTDFICAVYRKPGKDADEDTEEDADGQTPNPFGFRAPENEREEVEDIGFEEKRPGLLLVEFATTSSLDFAEVFPQHRINRVQYVLRRPDGEQEPGVLVRRELPYAGVPLEGVDWREIEVARGVNQADFGFGAAGEELEETWGGQDAGDAVQDAPPPLVSLRLTLVREGRERTWSTAIPVAASFEDAQGGS